MNNKELFKDKWHQLKGKIQTKWGKLTNDDLTVVNGERQELLGRIQQRYGISKDEAEKQVQDFEKTHLIGSGQQAHS